MATIQQIAVAYTYGAGTVPNGAEAQHMQAVLEVLRAVGFADGINYVPVACEICGANMGACDPPAAAPERKVHHLEGGVLGTQEYAPGQIALWDATFTCGDLVLWAAEGTAPPCGCECQW